MNSIFKYTENNGEVIITGLKEGVADASIVIPETIDGMPVVEIVPWAFESTSIVDIKIGANIRKIYLPRLFVLFFQLLAQKSSGGLNQLNFHVTRCDAFVFL